MKKINLIKSLSVSAISIPLLSGIGLMSVGCSSSQSYADILTINDMHGAIDQSNHKTENLNRAPAIDCLFNEYLKAWDEDTKNTGRDDATHLLLNGDIVQGGNMTVFSDQPGEWIWRVIDKLPYFYSSIGNHEVDWGINYMAEQFSYMGHLKWLCCNLYDKVNQTLGTEYLTIEDYTIIKVGDLNVGLVGYTSVDINKSSSGVIGNYQALDASSDEQIPLKNGTKTTGTNVLQNAIDACWNNTNPDILDGEKPDTVLLLAHAGADLDTKGNPEEENPEYSKDSEIFKVVHKINGVDGVLSSHSHRSYLLQVSDKDNKKIPVGQADWHNESMLQTKIFFDKDTKKNIKVEMSLRDSHTEKSMSDLEYRESEWFQLVNNNYAYFNDKVQQVNRTSALTVQANSKNAATFTKSTTENGYGEIPYLGNIFCKTMVNELTPTKIADTAYKATKDAISAAGWTFTGLDFYLDGDDTTASGMSPSSWNSSNKGAYTYGDISNVWKFQQSMYIVKATIADLENYYTELNCKKKPNANSHDIVDAIYSSKYKLKFTGSTVATSSGVTVVNNDGTTTGITPNKEIFIGMSSFMRDNRGGEYFSKYAPKDSVLIDAQWTLNNPSTKTPMTINAYLGNTFAFIYAARELGGYDESDPTKIMMDLTDTSTIYQYKPSDSFYKAS